MIRYIISKSRQRVLQRVDPVRFARELGVDIGARCRLLRISASTFGSEPYLISLGDHVTVTGGVRFVTHDGGVWVFRDERPTIDAFAPIRVGNNVFIGLNVIVLPGVTIGNDVVIAAGSVVTGDVESQTVAAGVPAKPISSLSDYRERSFSQAFDLKGLSSTEKRKLLVRRFPHSRRSPDR